MDQLLNYVLNKKLSDPGLAIDPSSVGSIWDDLGYISSGFSLMNRKLIITSAHVLNKINGTIYYVSTSDVEGQDFNKHELIIVNILKEYDLALLESKNGEDVCKDPFPLASKFNPCFGERIFYYGFDQKNGLNQKYNKDQYGHSIEPAQGRYIRDSTVIRIGKTSKDNGGHLADYIEYYGYSVPGYSGGVTMNRIGEAIAVNTFSWVTHGFWDKETDLSKNKNILTLNQAFSILPIRQSIDEWQKRAVV